MASNQPDLFAELEEMISCALCLERCQQPRTLPCLHAFCLSCLRQLIQTARQHSEQTDGQMDGQLDGQTARQSDTISCPSCRLQLLIPPSGAEAFPTMFHFATLTETLDRFKGLGLSQKPECTLCLQDGKHADGSKLCTECMKVFCPDCLNNIHNKLMPDHNLLDCTNVKLEDLNSILKNTPEKCQEHGQDISLYCESCKELVCLMCSVLSHEGHTKQQLAKVVDVHKKCLEDVHDQMEGRVEHYQQCLKKVDDEVQNRQTNMQTKLQALQQQSENIHTQVREFTKQLKSEIESETANSIKKLESLKQTLNEEMACLIDSGKKLKMSINHGNSPLIIRTSIKDKQIYQTLLQDLSPKHALPKLAMDLQLADVRKLSQEILIGKVDFKYEDEPLEQHKCTVVLTDEAGGHQKSEVVPSKSQTGGQDITSTSQAGQGSSPGSQMGAQTVLKTPKVTVNTWTNPQSMLRISDCAADGSYITLQYTGSFTGNFIAGRRMERVIDGKLQVNATLPGFNITPGRPSKVYARGRKAAGGGTDYDIECDIQTWGVGDNIVTTLHCSIRMNMATHTQTTQYV